jgi:hypothetical protein
MDTARVRHLEDPVIALVGVHADPENGDTSVHLTMKSINDVISASLCNW